MAKEVKMYEAKDGKIYKTESGAIKWDNKLLIQRKLDELLMTENELQEKLIEVAKTNKKIEALINGSGSWVNWPNMLIEQINEKLWDKSVKKTIYVNTTRGWGKPRENILFTEEGPEFTDKSLHTKDVWKVKEVEDVSDIVRKVHYIDKYTPAELALKKLLISKEKLSGEEINTLLFNHTEVYREEGDNRRWSRSILSVIDIEGDLYAIDWEEGLTEGQENEFYEQPYPVELEEKEVVTVETIITRKEVF